MRTGSVATWLAIAAALAVHTTTAGAQVSEDVGQPRGVPGPLSPPVGEERKALIGEIREAYPDMPERLVPMLTDLRLQVDDRAPCELLEWLVSPESDAPEAAQVSAALLLPTCRLPIDDLSLDEARAMLGDQAIAAELREGVLTVVVLSTDPAVRVCCSIQGAPERLGASDYWALRSRLPEADRAMLTFMTRSSLPQRPVMVRGALAPPAPLSVQGRLQGQVQERQLKSAALGETRKLLIYLPPDWSRTEQWPVIYLADGAAGMFAPIVERMITEGEIEPVVLVSALSAPEGIVGVGPSLQVDPRSAEYINRFPGGLGVDRFERHMRFFAEELTQYAQAEFGASSKRDSVSVAGFSSGGVLALWAGLLHPETFGHAIAMSPGMVFIEPADLLKTPRARIHLSGGIYEPFFARAAYSAEESLRAAEFDVIGRYLAAGHAQDQWELVFHEAVRQIYRQD